MDLRMRLAATTLSIAACLPLGAGAAERQLAVDLGFAPGRPEHRSRRTGHDPARAWARR